LRAIRLERGPLQRAGLLGDAALRREALLPLEQLLDQLRFGHAVLDGAGENSGLFGKLMRPPRAWQQHRDSAVIQSGTATAGAVQLETGHIGTGALFAV
jgi:hypothetical protein